jgi:hypothetical protein
MTGWTLAKYVLTLAGLALLFLGDSVGKPWLGYAGLGLVVVAFLLRFSQRARDREPGIRNRGWPPPGSERDGEE